MQANQPGFFTHAPIEKKYAQVNLESSCPPIFGGENIIKKHLKPLSKQGLLVVSTHIKNISQNMLK